MTITLTPEQMAWIDERVARGEYVSQEDAAQRLIDAAIHGRTPADADDLAWAKPLVDEALAQVERGEVMSHQDYRASIETFFEKLKS